jgi:hypothetical protein
LESSVPSPSKSQEYTGVLPDSIAVVSVKVMALPSHCGELKLNTGVGAEKVVTSTELEVKSQLFETPCKLTVYDPAAVAAYVLVMAPDIKEAPLYHW